MDEKVVAEAHDIHSNTLIPDPDEHLSIEEKARIVSG